MKIDGTHEINAPRERVYALITDPEVLRRCIPGCESLEKTGEDTYAAIIKAGVGMVKGTFKGSVKLAELRPPEHYRLEVDGKGGPGFVKGTGDFDLEEKDGATLIRYAGEMQVGGTIAGIGQRMIHGAERRQVEEFLSVFPKSYRLARSATAVFTSSLRYRSL